MFRLIAEIVLKHFLNARETWVLFVLNKNRVKPGCHRFVQSSYQWTIVWDKSCVIEKTRQNRRNKSGCHGI